MNFETSSCVCKASEGGLYYYDFYTTGKQHHECGIQNGEGIICKWRWKHRAMQPAFYWRLSLSQPMYPWKATNRKMGNRIMANPMRKCHRFGSVVPTVGTRECKTRLCEAEYRRPRNLETALTKSCWCRLVFAAKAVGAPVLSLQTYDFALQFPHEKTLEIIVFLQYLISKSYKHCKPNWEGAKV